MSNAVANVSANVGAIDLSQGYTSIVGDDFETRKKVYNAVTNSEKLSDNLGKTLHVTHILTQPVVNEPNESGVVETYTRTTLLTADGKAYSASSTGILNSAENLLRALGEPSGWPAEGIAMKVVEKKSSRPGFKFFSIELV